MRKGLPLRPWAPWRIHWICCQAVRYPTGVCIHVILSVYFRFNGRTSPRCGAITATLGYLAEKFNAMIVLGMANSRMKNYFDIWMLSRKFTIEADVLKEAMVTANPEQPGSGRLG